MNNTQDKNNPEETKDLDYYLGHIRYDMTNLIKWLVLAVLTGLTVGFISSLFARALKFVTNYRAENTWIFFLLPVSGLVIVFLYQKFGREDGGTNQVLSTIRSQDDVPFRSAPLIFVSTILTHLEVVLQVVKVLRSSLAEALEISLEAGSGSMKKTVMSWSCAA